MTTPFKPALLALAAAAWLSTPTLVQAEFVPRLTPMQVIAEPAGLTNSPHQALDFLTQAIARDAQWMDGGRQPVTPARGDFEFKTEGEGEGESGRAFKLGVGKLIEPPKQLRGDVDLFLWSLLRLVHAQKEGKHFELVDRGVEFVISNSNQPSAVPLPGALWLFVMGLLGLAGTRLTGKRDEKTQAALHEPSLPMGSPMPA